MGLASSRIQPLAYCEGNQVISSSNDQKKKTYYISSAAPIRLALQPGRPKIKKDGAGITRGSSGIRFTLGRIGDRSHRGASRCRIDRLPDNYVRIIPAMGQLVEPDTGVAVS
ncbi:hypothetical protein JTE90_019856 [Oedothorax gibbosus]|uniref:Ribosomal protein L2 n=1 Tax=Oedothorax gibbosus TaxID=931172 RepID=A0AAV6VXA0_9ARAC|nr:hypothetical protein JTE90_019856 [Oedothorax gibbosus]